MKITIEMTASEILDAGLWKDYCEATGTSEWALNEGQIDGDDVLMLPEQLILQALTRHPNSKGEQ